MGKKGNFKPHHTWWPILFVAADEHECKHCGMRLQQITRSGVLEVLFPVGGGRLPEILSKQLRVKMFLYKVKGVRRWMPTLEIPPCIEKKKRV